MILSHYKCSRSICYGYVWRFFLKLFFFKTIYLFHRIIQSIFVWHFFFPSIFSAEACNLIFYSSTLIILHSYIIVIIIIINKKNERVELIYLMSCVSNHMSPKVKLNNLLDESGDKSNAITNHASIHSLSRIDKGEDPIYPIQWRISCSLCHYQSFWQ